VIVEVDEHVMSDAEAPLHSDSALRHVEREGFSDSIEVSQTTKHVHFGSDTENVDPDHSTAAFITPHPRSKMSIKRRTLSPNMRETKRVKESRTSLPAVLSQDGETESFKIVNEWAFMPLNAVLEKRIAELRAHPHYKPSSQRDEDQEMVDNNMLVLDSYEQIEYPQLHNPSTPIGLNRRITAVSGTDAVERSTTKMRVGWDVERHRFHEAILQFQKEAERAKGDLQILNIEVQSLGFSEDGNQSTLDILRSIRVSFDGVREFLETELPGTVPEDATNEDLVEILIANVKEFADRLRIADKELVEKGTLNVDLGIQINNLIDRLAAREVRVQELKDNLDHLKESKDAQKEEILELEELLGKAETERNERQAELDNEIAVSQKLEQEKAELENTLERLQKSLKDYQDEETRLTGLINTMEEEHRKTVQSMNTEREEAVRELEDRLDVEVERHVVIEKEFTASQTTITQVEEEIQATERDLEAMTKERDELQAELDEEEKAHGSTQADLDQAQATITDLETRIARVEEEAENMEEQLATLREQNHTERQQREGAEQALDERDQEIEELNKKLREQGKEANELRLKAHDMQTKNQQRITEMELEMSDRDAEFQTDMEEEVKRREDAEGLAQLRIVEIRENQEKLMVVEQQMRDLLAERDARIEELEDEVEQKTSEILNLQDDLRYTEDNHRKQLQVKDNQTAELQDQIADLDVTITNQETTIRTIEQHLKNANNLHDSQTEERNAAIADLNARLADLEAENEDHKHDKAGLERRVESEAMQMLQVSNDFSEQIQDLKNQLLEKQKAITKVEKTSREADHKTTELLAAREEEVETWKATAVERDTIITTLEEERETTHLKFKAYVRRSMDTMDELKRQLAEAKAAVDNEGDALKAEGEDMLAELERSVVRTRSVVTRQTETTRSVKKVKGGRKSKGKRVVDSAIGLGAEVEDEDEEGMMIEA